MKKLFLAGEGPNELGRWSNEPEYRDLYNDVGVIEAVIKKVTTSGWKVVDACRWKNIRKYRTGGHKEKEKRNVLGAVLQAIDAKCEVLVFARDRDGKKNKERQQQVEDAIRIVTEDEDFPVEIIGGMAIEKIESWLCAISGKTKSEDMGIDKVEEYLREAGIASKDTKAMVDLIESRSFEDIPKDAKSLNSWLDMAENVLSDKSQS
jgi:hypothetical protein